MQEPPQLEERKLEQRGWVGCLLAFALAAMVMALMAAVPHSVFPSDPSQPRWLRLTGNALAEMAKFGLGIAGLVLALRLMFWSLKGDMRRQDCLASFSSGDTLPGQSLDRDLYNYLSGDRASITVRAVVLIAETHTSDPIFAQIRLQLIVL